MRIFYNFQGKMRFFLKRRTRQQVAVGNEGNKRQRLLVGWLAGRETLAEMPCLPFACVLYQTVLRLLRKKKTQNYCIGPIIVGMPRERRQRRGRQSYILISPLRVYHSFHLPSSTSAFFCCRYSHILQPHELIAYISVLKYVVNLMEKS